MITPTTETHADEAAPVELPRLKRGDIVGYGDEAVEVELHSVSGNITVRLGDGSLKTLTEERITRL